MPVTAHPSLKWELILDNSVREYPDKRQVCCDTPKGKREYQKRIEEMALRQHGICGLGPHLLRDATFEHSAGRGMNAGHRDDRIVDKNGDAMNCAACFSCNGGKGSKRV